MSERSYAAIEAQNISPRHIGRGIEVLASLPGYSKPVKLAGVLIGYLIDPDNNVNIVLGQTETIKITLDPHAMVIYFKEDR